jgi:FdhD protein
MYSTPIPANQRNLMNKTELHDMILHENNTVEVIRQALIMEEPLSIRIDGNAYSVVMRTPGDEIYHAAGFCLAEGIVDHPDDFATIGFCTEEGVNVVTATLTSERRNRVEHLLGRRGFISQTSCGICGKELVKDLYQIVRPVSQTFNIPIATAMACVDRLVEQQHLFSKTGSTHASMIFDSENSVMAYAEDVGRHNALDKAIGRVFMNRKIDEANIAALSSRISYELVQKAARAGIEMMVSMSRPTALAVTLAKSLNMTLACVGRRRGFMIFCGKERFQEEAEGH